MERIKPDSAAMVRVVTGSFANLIISDKTRISLDTFTITKNLAKLAEISRSIFCIWNPNPDSNPKIPNLNPKLNTDPDINPNLKPNTDWLLGLVI